MALLFMDGFDAGDAALKWSATAGTSTSSTDTRFSVGRSWYVNDNGGSLTKSYTAATQIFIGFALKFPDFHSGGQNQAFFQIYGDSGTTAHLALRFTNGTTLVLTRGGTTLATATVTAPMSWGTYFEISASINATTGVVIVKTNNTTVINFSGNTKNGGTNNSSDLLFFAGANMGFTGRTTQFDDFYLCDDTGAGPYNTFLGDVRVHTIVPNAAGSSTQFTPSSGANYTTVDELPYSATDYVYGTAGQTDMYAASDLPGGTGIIYGVQTNAVVKKTDAGNISGRAALKSGASTYYGSSVSVGTADQVIRRIDQTNPATSAAWTSSEVNGIEIGVGAV